MQWILVLEWPDTTPSVHFHRSEKDCVKAVDDMFADTKRQLIKRATIYFNDNSGVALEIRSL